MKEVDLIKTLNELRPASRQHPGGQSFKLEWEDHSMDARVRTMQGFEVHRQTKELFHVRAWDCQGTYAGGGTEAGGRGIEEVLGIIRQFTRNNLIEWTELCGEKMIDPDHAHRYDDCEEKHECLACHRCVGHCKCTYRDAISPFIGEQA